MEADIASQAVGLGTNTDFSLIKKDSNKADAILIASFYYETYKIEE